MPKEEKRKMEPFCGHSEPTQSHHQSGTLQTNQLWHTHMSANIQAGVCSTVTPRYKGMSHVTSAQKKTLVTC